MRRKPLIVESLRLTDLPIYDKDILPADGGSVPVEAKLMKEEDIPYHIPTAYKKGDKVKAVADTPTVHAWHCEWTVQAERMVTLSAIMVIEGVDPLLGFLCRAKGYNNVWLPSCALAPAYGVQSGPCIIEVPSV